MYRTIVAIKGARPTCLAIRENTGHVKEATAADSPSSPATRAENSSNWSVPENVLLRLSLVDSHRIRRTPTTAETMTATSRKSGYQGSILDDPLVPLGGPDVVSAAVLSASESWDATGDSCCVLPSRRRTLSFCCWLKTCSEDLVVGSRLIPLPLWQTSNERAVCRVEKAALWNETASIPALRNRLGDLRSACVGAGPRGDLTAHGSGRDFPETSSGGVSAPRVRDSPRTDTDLLEGFECGHLNWPRLAGLSSRILAPPGWWPRGGGGAASRIWPHRGSDLRVSGARGSKGVSGPITPSLTGPGEVP